MKLFLNFSTLASELNAARKYRFQHVPLMAMALSTTALVAFSSVAGASPALYPTLPEKEPITISPVIEQPELIPVAEPTDTTSVAETTDTTSVAEPTDTTSSDTNPTTSEIIQRGDGQNTLEINADSVDFFLNSAGEGGAVQDADSSETNALTLNLSNNGNTNTNANYIFVSQLGNVTQTLTIEGGGNTARLIDFGGTSTISDVFKITGNENDVTLQSNAPLGAVHDNLDITLVGDYIVLDVTTDEFAEVVANITGTGDNVTVVQNNTWDGVGEFVQNVALIDISNSVIGNFVNITQDGKNNSLDFDLVGDKNNITVSQSNSAEALNKLTISLTDDAAVLTIDAHGPGTNSFIVNGTDNNLTVNSDSGQTGIGSTNAQASIEVYGDTNAITSTNYSSVYVTIGDPSITANGNKVTTTGDVEVEVYGDNNTLAVTNQFDDSFYDYIPRIVVDSPTDSLDGNNVTLRNIQSGVTAQEYFDVSITGGGNSTDLSVKDMFWFDLTITGNGNKVQGDVSTAGGVVDIDMLGDNNSIYLDQLVGLDGSEIMIDLEGNSNIFTVANTLEADIYFDLNVKGNSNNFSYDLGNKLKHVIGGNNFTGSVEADSLQSYYAVDYTNIGSGFSKVTSGGSSMIIKNDCGSYSEVDGIGSCS